MLDSLLYFFFPALRPAQPVPAPTEGNPFHDPNYFPQPGADGHYHSMAGMD